MGVFSCISSRTIPAIEDAVEPQEMEAWLKFKV
jgi:hypothetical protein